MKFTSRMGKSGIFGDLAGTTFSERPKIPLAVWQGHGTEISDPFQRFLKHTVTAADVELAGFLASAALIERVRPLRRR
jgi:hypothetical protein